MHSSQPNQKIDAHQHFWQFNPVEHVWMTDEMATLRRNFMPPDLEPLLHGIGFNGCVTVQVRQNLEETRWLLELADRHDFIRGVVGWVDLRSPELNSQLPQVAGRKKLVGVRHNVPEKPDENFMVREDFRRGIARLREFGLRYDLLIFPRQL